MPVARYSQETTEVLLGLEAQAYYSQVVAEVLQAYTDPSFTTVTGAGFSQVVAEVLMAFADPQVRVSQVVAEVLMTAAGPEEGGAVSGGSHTLSYGIAV